MKRCPQCNRIEPDDTLAFCRVDGATLAEAGDATSEELGTIRFDAMPNSRELSTTILPPAKASGDVGLTTAETRITESQGAKTGELVMPSTAQRGTKRTIAVVVAAIVTLAAIGACVYF